jgi:hypothetical protein
MSSDMCLEEREGVLRPSAGHLRLDQVLHSCEAELIEALGLRTDGAEVVKVDESPASPKRHGLTKRPDSSLWVAGCEALPRLGGELAEALSIDALGIPDEDVARVSSLQYWAIYTTGALGKNLPEARNQGVQRGGGARRCATAPQLVDQLVAGNYVIEPEHQRGEERTLLTAADRDHTATRGHLEAAEETELDRLGAARRSHRWLQP